MLWIRAMESPPPPHPATHGETVKDHTHASVQKPVSTLAKHQTTPGERLKVTEKRRDATTNATEQTINRSYALAWVARVFGSVGEHFRDSGATDSHPQVIPRQYRRWAVEEKLDSFASGPTSSTTSNHYRENRLF